MEFQTWVFIGLLAFSVSTLTLFSGFGLGTLLMPAFAFLFPLDVAVAATAVVHGANNLFKLLFFWKEARLQLVIRFGFPALAGAVLGASLLGGLAVQEPLLRTSWFSVSAEITPLKLTLGILILGFALLELLPRFQKLEFSPKHLLWGGALSGFFGGLSGHQGALRSAFLAKVDISPSQFVGTTAVLGSMVDGARLCVYALAFSTRMEAPLPHPEDRLVVAVACLCAFGGVLLGKRLLKKVTLRGVQWTTGSLLLLIGSSMVLGIF